LTLLLTEVGKHGVVMVAESAARSEQRTPFTGKPAFRLTFGAKKIVPIHRLHCAVGVWGMGAVEAKEFAFTPDVWIADFLEHRNELDSIRAVAETLAKELKELLKEPDRPFGFQIAGCPPGREPEFWEATNRDPFGGNCGWVPWNHIEHGASWKLKLPDDGFRLARGLGYGTGALCDLDQTTSRIIGFAPELGGINAGILQRAEYLSACVRFICDFEKAGGDERISIGGDTSYAAIGVDGVIHFKPPYGDVARVT
jgi:hypothetical protein